MMQRILMMTKPLILLFTSIAILQNACLRAADYYVAPDGNDNWSGKIATANPQRTDGPFASLERAREAVRALKRSGPWPGSGVVVEVLAETYELPRTFVLTREDSGRDGAPMVYRPQTGADVRLLGGRRVEGSEVTICGSRELPDGIPRDSKSIPFSE